MNLYFLGILAALVVFFAVGIGAGRMVKDTNCLLYTSDAADD